MLVLLFLAGLISGLVNSVAGGGIMVVFPAFLTAGLDPVIANATSNLAAWPGALSSAYGYRRYLAKLPAKYFYLLIPCLFGALIGAWLLSHTPAADFRNFAPWLVAFAVLLFIVQPFLHFHLSKNLQRHHSAPIVLMGLALIPMAIYGGYFGAGLGFVMLAFLSLTSIHNIYQINGLKNLFSLVITLVCTVYFSQHGLISWHNGVPAMLGSAVGGLIGSHLAQRVSPAAVHSGIIALGVIVTAVLFVKL